MAKQTAAQQAKAMEEERRRKIDPTEKTEAGGPITFQEGFGDRGGAAGGGEWTPGRGPGRPGTDMGFGNDGGGGVEGGATITDSERAEIKKRALARYGHS